MRLYSHPLMKRLLVFLPLTLLLAGCIDTTGISPESSKKPAGNPNAAVVLTEFGDLQCPSCRASHEQYNKPILGTYGGRIAFQFKQFPLTQIHPYAMKAAQASECAADQGKFWEFLDINYENQDDLKNKPYEDWAARLQLDADLFHRCLASGIKKDAVNKDFAEGMELKVNSTPSYFINGVRAPSGTLSELTSAIEAALKNVQNVPL